MKKLSLILAALLLVSSIASCSDAHADSGNAAATTAQSAQTEAETSALDARKSISDNLPEANFDGETFRLYASTEKRAQKFYAEASNGDVINDAIYNAILTTEQRFNTDIVCILSDLGGNEDVTHNDAIRKAVQAEEDICDVAENHDSLSGSAAIEGMYTNLRNLERLDFSQPWWAPNAVESLTYMEQLYLGSSAMSITGFNQTRVIFFNKDLLNRYNMEEPYETVFAGEWYLDTLINQTKDVYEDLNGNSTKDKEDFYGYIAGAPIYCYLESYGIPTIIKEEDSLTTGVNNARTITMVEKLYNLLYESDGAMIYRKGQDDDHNVALFGNNQSLYAFGEIGNAVDYLRHTEVNYGIIPTPKLDELQEDYLAAYTDRFFVVPRTLPTDRYEFVGTIIEAMSAEGYRQIFPAYYEIALKQKFTFDNESMQVLDLINDCRILDFAFVYCADINGLINGLLSPDQSPSSNFASKYASQEKSINAKLKNVYKAFEKMYEDAVM